MVCSVPSDYDGFSLDSVYDLHQVGILMEGPGGPNQSLRALLCRAGRIISPSDESCQTLVPAIFAHSTALQEVGLSYPDSVSKAYEEVIGARIANFMCFSHLLKDLEDLSMLLSARSTNSTPEPSVLDAFEAVEQGISMIVRATAVEI